METRKATHNLHMKDVAFPDEAEQRNLCTSWRGVTRRAILLATCAATASTLMFPSASFAAEWVNVDGVEYDQAAGDEAGTWSWDGADNMALNGYDGSGISAAGKLDITYTGENNVTADNDGISVENGKDEDAELTIKGEEGSSLTVDAGDDAIYSEGDVTVSGGGTVTAISGAEDDAVHSEGDVTIQDATVITEGGEDAIEAVNLTIKNANVEASGDYGIYAYETASITGSTVKVDSVWTGVVGSTGVTVDNSSLTVSVVDEDERPDYSSADGIAAYRGDITIKNKSLVDVAAKSSGTSYGIYAEAYHTESKGGHVTIADSTVKVKAETTSSEQNAWDSSVGIVAQTYNMSDVASVDITHSNVDAEGASIAILARNFGYAKDDPEFGTITIKDSTIITPQNGKLANYEFEFGDVRDRSDDNTALERGMTIVSADTNTDEVITDEDTLMSAAAKKAVIVADEEPEPEPEPEIKPAGYVTPTGGSSEKKAIPQTGDAASAGLIASAIAGASALITGLFMARKRES